MGDYLTRGELVASAGAAVDALAGDQTEAANQAAVERAIEEAEAEVNAYLADKYPTPVSPVPPVLAVQVRRLVLWHLLSAHGYRPGTADESIRLDYLDAVKFLTAVRDGKISLGTTAEDGSSQPEAQTAAHHPASALPDGWRDNMP